MCRNDHREALQEEQQRRLWMEPRVSVRAGGAQQPG